MQLKLANPFLVRLNSATIPIFYPYITHAIQTESRTWFTLLEHSIFLD